jgi:hypothetical protein
MPGVDRLEWAMSGHVSMIAEEASESVFWDTADLKRKTYLIVGQL